LYLSTKTKTLWKKKETQNVLQNNKEECERTGNCFYPSFFFQGRAAPLNSKVAFYIFIQQI